MLSCRAVSGGRPRGPGATQPCQCPQPRGAPAPHRGHRAWRCVPGLGKPSAGNRLPSGARPAQTGGGCAWLGPQAQRGPCHYFGAALRDALRAARKRGAACPGTRQSYARNVHARVAARQALPRHIPTARAAGSTGGYRPGAREQGGSGAEGRAAPGGEHHPCDSACGGTRSTAALGQDRAQHGWGIRVPWAERPQPRRASGSLCAAVGLPAAALLHHRCLEDPGRPRRGPGASSPRAGRGGAAAAVSRSPGSSASPAGFLESTQPHGSGDAVAGGQIPAEGFTNLLPSPEKPGGLGPVFRKQLVECVTGSQFSSAHGRGWDRLSSPPQRLPGWGRRSHGDQTLSLRRGARRETGHEHGGLGRWLGHCGPAGPGSRVPGAGTGRAQPALLEGAQGSRDWPAPRIGGRGDPSPGS